MEINKKPLKIVIYSIIGLLWVISIVYLFRAKHEETLAAVPPAVKSEVSTVSEWMGLYMGDKKIGYDYEEILPSNNGFVFKTRMFMRIMLMGQQKEITTIVDSTTDGDYALKSIDFSLKTSAMEIAASGKVKDNILYVSLKGPGGETNQQIHLNGPVLSSDSIVMRIVKDGFSRSEYNFHIFDPTIQQELPVYVKVVGKELRTIMNSPVDTFKLEVNIKDMKETMWVTPQGETVEEISPLGFRAVLEPKTVALTKGWNNEPVDLISSTAIRAAGLQVTYPASAKHIEAYLSGISDKEPLPSFGFQTRQGSLITIQTPQNTGTYELPYKGEKDVHGLSVQQELLSSSLINSDNPDIISTEKSILNGETDARKAVELINQWVYSHVRDSFTVALPRSIDLLKNPEGDCKAHTILFTSLARAAGIPTKMAMGVVLMPDGYFYYHAWPLVYLNGWVPADPTFGEFPADATHIILASGDLTNWMDILGVVGRLQINIMRVSP
jgi:transglutaminase-like putative cysteine protease